MPWRADRATTRPATDPSRIAHLLKDRRLAIFLICAVLFHFAGKRDPNCNFYKIGFSPCLVGWQSA
jgi:hypothetical protein